VGDESRGSDHFNGKVGPHWEGWWRGISHDAAVHPERDLKVRRLSALP
jgi:hypothetical protein